MTPAEPLYPDEKLVLIVRLLEEAGIPYAVGGAIALFYWGEPRATADIDINVFVSTNEASSVFSVLERAGILADTEHAKADVAATAQTRMDFSGTPVDFFFSDLPFHESCEQRAVRVPFGDMEINVLSAEDLVVCKVMFDRAKDWLDVEQVLYTQGVRFEATYARDWIEEMLGSMDERVGRFDRLVSAARRSPETGRTTEG